MDIHTKTDSETKIQLIVLKLDELDSNGKKEAVERMNLESRLKVLESKDSKIAISNLEARLKGLEELKLATSIGILETDVKELKKKIMELSEFKNDFITATYNKKMEKPKWKLW